MGDRYYRSLLQSNVKVMFLKDGGITTSTALRLAKYFDTIPDFWLNLQRANDIYRVLKKEAEQIDKIKPAI